MDYLYVCVGSDRLSLSPTLRSALFRGIWISNKKITRSIKISVNSTQCLMHFIKWNILCLKLLFIVFFVLNFVYFYGFTTRVVIIAIIFEKKNSIIRFCRKLMFSLNKNEDFIFQLISEIYRWNKTNEWMNILILFDLWPVSYGLFSFGRLLLHPWH